MKVLRLKMKIEALTTAAAMIEEIAGGGLTNDDLEITEKEFEVFLSECSKLGKSLSKRAARIYQKNSQDLESNQ
ncbi:hypothetical protein [Acinetobacter lactucae]|uniref:hypothetical protein n=1 Tax=Acinetobacter lactucae TaxID=1785128 RepID=UPI001580B6F2|nr:hypothetical protein [Acinetobacter lactucae]NUG21185.1 hypothetical protein [Acinetobacter lactucae]